MRSVTFEDGSQTKYDSETGITTTVYVRKGGGIGIMNRNGLTNKRGKDLKIKLEKALPLNSFAFGALLGLASVGVFFTIWTIATQF